MSAAGRKMLLPETKVLPSVSESVIAGNESIAGYFRIGYCRK